MEGSEKFEKGPFQQLGAGDAEQMEIKGNIRECCIAFIDILGFKNMVNHNIDKVILALRYIKRFRDSFYQLPSREGFHAKAISELSDEEYEYRNLPKATMFSDSIVISKEIDETFHFSDFISFIAQLQFELLREGILLRGGIDIGEVYHDDAFIFGKGMVLAYTLESQISVYPRITVSENAINRVQEQDDKSFEDKFKNFIRYNNEKICLYPEDLEGDFDHDEFRYIKKDKEGIEYIDYMYFGCEMILASEEDMLALDWRFCEGFIDDTLSIIRKLICDGLESADGSVQKKYSWMRHYFNRTIRRVIKTYECRSNDIQNENAIIINILRELVIAE